MKDLQYKILKAVKSKEGTIGLNKADLLNLIVDLKVPIAEANAYINSYLDAKFLQKTTTLDRYILDTRAILWLAAEDFKRTKNKSIKNKLAKFFILIWRFLNLNLVSQIISAIIAIAITTFFFDYLNGGHLWERFIHLFTTTPNHKNIKKLPIK